MDESLAGVIIGLMPFHAGGHKPKASLPVPRVKVRLQFAAWGAGFLTLGIFRFSHGIHLVANWQAMPMYSGAVLGTGGLLILLALTPFSWLEAVFHWLDSRWH